MDNEYLEKLHCEIIHIMNEVDRVCNKYNLQYYLIGGTLLGAVRHGGFIPWDDDLDIVMPREDFNRFIELAPSHLGEQFKLEWITTNPDYFLRFAKVCKCGTSFVQEIGQGAQSDFGIFVDIFPLDTTNGYDRKVEKRRLISKKLGVMMYQRKEQKYDIKHILCKIIPNRLLHLTATKIMSMKCKNEGDFYSNFGSQYKIERQTMPKAWYGKGISMRFCDWEYCVPVEYRRVLQSIFGEKYMELPPVEKRKTHYPLKVVFSDGTEMTFLNEGRQITVEESISF